MSSPKKSAPKNLEKLKMATINEVYNRIIWDSRLNRNLFVTGFPERVSDAIREKPLAHWDGSGDIPWHRIRYIRCGDMVVWDRDQHLGLKLKLIQLEI
jgi:poly(A) polymerase